MTTMEHILFFSALLLSIGQANANGINDKNWMSHPEIKKIRAIYNEVEAAISDYKIKTKECAPDFETNYLSEIQKVYIDSNGIIRKYYDQTGSGDGVVTNQFYFDKNGNHVFTFAVTRAANDTIRETRVYFGENKMALYENEKLIQGPGWYHHELLEYVENPKKNFAESSCPLTK